MYTFVYRFLLDNQPVPDLPASSWRMHALFDDEEERDSVVEQYEGLFPNEPNRCWQIVKIDLPGVPS